MIKSLLAGLLPLSILLMGFAEPKHSKLEITPQKSGQQIEWTFKVIPNPDMAATFDDAPWSLTFKDAKGLKFDGVQTDAKNTAKFSHDKLDRSIPGYKVKATAAGKSGKMKYEFHTFVCTKEKTRCYREVHKGDMDWGV